MAKEKSSHFTAEFILQVKEILLKEKVRLENDLAGFTRKNPKVAGDYNSDFPDYGDKEDENAAEVAEYAASLPLEDNLEKGLRDVNKALDNISKDTFGVCKYCKKPIEEKRLLARPTSSACVACKKTITQEL